MASDDVGYVLGPAVPEGPLTARNLADYLECPRKFMLSFFTTPTRTGEFIGGPAVLHRAVRSALLGFYAAPSDLQSVTDAFEEAWDGSLCKDSKEEEDLHRDGLLMLEKHIESWSPPAEQWSCDVHMEADIGGQRFAAVADVLCTGPAQAVRLTTSRRPPSPGELREDISWVLLYLLGQRAAGRDTVGVMMDLRGGRRLEYSLAADEVSRMEARLPAIAGSIRREREYRPQKGKHCRWCRSRSDCPAWKGP